MKEEWFSLFKTAEQVFQKDFSLKQQWMITGDWEEGQELLISLITGNKRIASGHFRFSYKTSFVSYQHRLNDRNASYYQQRYYAAEIEGIKTLKDFLVSEAQFTQVKKFHYLLEAFNLRNLLGEEVVKLSNGESRKALILKALLSGPDVLILDNPQSGIDQGFLPSIENLFQNLSNSGLCIILKNSSAVFPSWVTHVLQINSPEDIQVLRAPFSELPQPAPDTINMPKVYVPVSSENFNSPVIKLNNVSVKYGPKTIFENISWEINAGEKWQLTGDNGAGKSTLLSLIYADHPQAYSNNIEIFGVKRGSGECIWDIKEKIGFYSPEMARYFDLSGIVSEVILKGISNHPYKKKNTDPALNDFAMQLFRYYFPESWLYKSLADLAPVHRQIVILLRALAANTPLLLLDEPFQGMDKILVQKSRHLLNICSAGKTLIFVSHNPGDIPSCVGHRFIIANGSGRVLG